MGSIVLDRDLHDHDPTARVIELDTLDHGESWQVEQNRSSVLHARGVPVDLAQRCCHADRTQMKPSGASCSTPITRA
ncbi:MAG: hypothetical protein ABI808_07555 [Pseudonocardiales bacterium]